MSVPTVSHDETSPPGGQAISLGDDRIREFKKQTREIIAVDHYMLSSGQGITWGQHKQVTLQEQADLGTGAVSATILGSQTITGKGELVYTDEDDNDIQITSGGALVAGQLANDTYFLAIDNAGTSTVNVLKVNTSDTITFGVVATLADASLMATSAAPTTDAMIANKKYVDDTSASQPSGMIVLYGAAAAPSGWLLCQGQAVNRTTYANLFTAIATTYGVGDGSTTFNLPDFQDTFPVGKGSTFTLGDQGDGEAGTLQGTGDDITMESESKAQTANAEGGSGPGTLGTHSHEFMVPYSTVNFIIKT